MDYKNQVVKVECEDGPFYLVSGSGKTTAEYGIDKVFIYNDDTEVNDTGWVTYLPKGLTVDQKKMTREETWADLFYPKVNMIPKDSPLRSGEAIRLTMDKCDHTWQNYVGYNQAYFFCTICDLKKEYE